MTHYDDGDPRHHADRTYTPPGEAGKHKAEDFGRPTAHYFQSDGRDFRFIVKIDRIVQIEKRVRHDGMGMPVWDDAPVTMAMLNQAYELGKAGKF